MGFVTIYFCDKVELLTQCVEYLEHDISLFFVACEILFGGILHQKSLGPGRKQGHQSLLFLVQNNKSAKTKVEQRTETRGGVFSLQEEKLCQTLCFFPYHCSSTTSMHCCYLYSITAVELLSTTPLQSLLLCSKPGTEGAKNVI